MILINKLHSNNKNLLYLPGLRSPEADGSCLLLLFVDTFPTGLTSEI